MLAIGAGYRYTSQLRKERRKGEMDKRGETGVGKTKLAFTDGKGRSC